jgi:Tfp pilus assembly protein PilO
MNRFWNRLSKRERSLALLAVVVVVAILLYDRVVTPLIERRTWIRDQLVLQPELFRRSLGYLGREKEIRTRLEEARRRVKAMDRLLLAGDTPSVIASALQKVVRDIATKEGIQIATTRVLDSTEAGSFLRIPIQVDVVGKIEQIANLIKFLDSNPKSLILDEVNIRSAGNSRRSRRNKRPIQLKKKLRASLVISGFARQKPARVAATDSR